MNEPTPEIREEVAVALRVVDWRMWAQRLLGGEGMNLTDAELRERVGQLIRGVK